MERRVNVVRWGEWGKFSKVNPNMLEGLAEFGKTSGEPALDPKTVELIALAVGVTTRCDGCIAAHAKKAAMHGATDQRFLKL